jgi:hypothetical protein
VSLLRWGGQKDTGKKQLVRAYIDTVPRHYSHYTTSSTNEYVDCASSALNWWKGPTEVNDDGTASRCFLEWLDLQHGTQHYNFYCTHSYFPGLHDERNNLPATLVGPNAALIPKPAVSYKYFLSVLNTFKLRFKDLSVDQCATCNLHRAKIVRASEADRPELERMWNEHKLQADKGYVHRARRKEDCASLWQGIPLHEQRPITFPRVAVPPLHRDLFDFTEVDMGGGLRTPLIKCGPQYYLRTLPSKPYYICSAVSGHHAFWWNETIGGCGADDIASVNYLYDTNKNVGAGSRTYWCDGTAAQTWNRCMFQYCLDCVNPESPTYFPDSTTALYDRIDIFRNPPGHTFMQPDAVHGCVSRYGASLSHVSSTEEWSSKVAAHCKSGTEAIHTVFMEQRYFRKWREYLRQMYRKNPRTTTGTKYRLLDYYWANFGWGTLPDGGMQYHPNEVWFYRCSHNNEEWYKEEPVKVVFSLNYKQDGSLPAAHLTLQDWLRSKRPSRIVIPIHYPQFQTNNEPIRLELAKQWDLRKLSTYLGPYLNQEAIDNLYPLPDRTVDDDNTESDSESASD